MLERQESILKAIIERYIPAADPVSSGFLADFFEHSWSSATIRNDMMELEHEGYLAKPHTSAGRIPTEKAYVTYVQDLMEDYEPAQSAAKKLEHALDRDEQNFVFDLAAACQRAVIAGALDHRVHIGGLAHLYAQLPAMEDVEAQAVAQAFDMLMQDFDELIEKIPDHVVTYIGHENPLNTQSSIILTGYRHADGTPGMIAILSPLRMDYRLCHGYLRLAQRLLSRV
jgi:transcriptional regulator of heat shock response